MTIPKGPDSIKELFEKFVFAEAFGNFEALVAMTSAGGTYRDRGELR